MSTSVLEVSFSPRCSGARRTSETSPFTVPTARPDMTCPANVFHVTVYERVLLASDVVRQRITHVMASTHSLDYIMSRAAFITSRGSPGRLVPLPLTYSRPPFHVPSGPTLRVSQSLVGCRMRRCFIKLTKASGFFTSPAPRMTLLQYSSYAIFGVMPPTCWLTKPTNAYGCPLSSSGGGDKSSWKDLRTSPFLEYKVATSCTRCFLFPLL
ncbi:hypothetical protein F4778DRAFT_609808 [Xylariomycetidae sp. FL2044]|nr:hypothetical protein F4778DRAFT_609808 [Xylariomycetidae sp. FL2044]